MRRLFAFIMVLALLAGCAAQTYRTARGNANLVKNGMTLDEVISTLGMKPTNGSGDIVQWRRGGATIYTGEPTGAIEFRFKDGRVIEVPEGGIFSKAAVAALAVRQEKQLAEWQRQAEAQALADAEAAKQKEASDLAARKDAEARQKEAQALLDAEEEKDRKAIEAEIKASKRSFFVCRDKVTCAKAFSLAQIFVQQNSDQKIQVATDTIIETYNPTENMKMGISVIKAPRAGTVEVLTMSPNCKSDSPSTSRVCRAKRTVAYLGFQSFIEEALSR